MPIAPSGLYWTTPLTGERVQRHGDGRVAKLVVKELPVIDEPKFPENGPVYDGVENFSIHFTGNGNLQTLEDPAKYFLINAYTAMARADFAVVVPELNFSFQGTAESTIAFVGEEVNGHYYVEGQQPSGDVFPSPQAPGPTP